MSILNQATNVHIQGSTITTIDGDQHIHYDPQPAVHDSQTAASQGFNTLYQHYSTTALFDAIAHSSQPRCLKGTRVAIIKDILARTKGKEKSGSILWLKGPAGAGKSALEYTIADICKNKGRLIGGFAFSRTGANSSDGTMLIPTLAIQLARSIPNTQDIIDRTMKANADIFERSQETQLRLLIIEPLRQVWSCTGLRDSFRYNWRYPTVIAIDGLDECSNRDFQRDIIESIGSAVRGLDFPLCFFIASRPEAHISQAFQKLQSDTQVRLSSMYLGEDATATRDIQTYLETKFREVRGLHPHLPESWPSCHIISQIVEQASGHFIYASAAMGYIMSVRSNPDARLRVILQFSRPAPGDSPFSQLNLLYSHILSSIENKDTALEIIGYLVLPKKYYSHPNAQADHFTIRDFNTPIIFEALFGLEPGDVRRLMSDLLSVVTIEKDDQPMKVIHASLGDFLLDESRSREYFIDPDKQCVKFARKYIDYIAKFKPFCFDMNDIEQFIIPSVSLCMNAGLIDELNTVLGPLDILSSFRSLVYSSPTQYPTIRHPQTFLYSAGSMPTAFIWETYIFEFQETRDETSASSKDIFVILTGQWQLIQLAVTHLSGRKIKLPDVPVAGQVRFRTPRGGDDPAIILVLVPTRYNKVPDFVAGLLDKRLVESEYNIKSIHTMYRYAPKGTTLMQDLDWFWLWSLAQILS